MSNTAAKKLQEKDVKAIFASVASGNRPPQRLKYKIIRVPRNGQKLSPPSFEFDDGIYVLLRAPKNQPQASVPQKLQGELLCDNELASLPPLPWSLSGPQYPKKNHAVQQRYCYPKVPRGSPQYSDKGGSMWTRVDSEGNEDIDCRIFHVYRSKKRGSVDKSLKSSSAATNDKGTRKSKRKSGGGGDGLGKKGRVVTTKTTTVQSITHSSLLHGDELPEIETSSLGPVDTSLNFSNDLFAPPTDNNFSFMPVVPSVASSSFDSMLLQNNPAFNSFANFAGRPQAAVGYYPPHAYGYGSWACAAPPIPELTTSEENANTHVISSVQDFSMRLQDMEASIHADILGSSETDQVLKLHLLQNWAKDIATQPLESTAKAASQPVKEAALQPKTQQPTIESLQQASAADPKEAAAQELALDPPKPQETTAAGKDVKATASVQVKMEIEGAPPTPPMIHEA